LKSRRLKTLSESFSRAKITLKHETSDPLFFKMFVGHLGLSYLISQAPRLKGKRLPLGEVIFLIFMGYVFDLDLLITGLNGINHHYLPIHTPLFGLLLGLLSYALLRRYFSRTCLFLVFPVLIGHLVLDEVAYWFYLLGWQKIIDISQINWFYPFVQNHGNDGLLNIGNVVASYLSQAQANVVLEIVLMILAGIVFLTSFFKKK